MEWLRRLREFVTGVTEVSYGSCGGDPIAWEKDLALRRAREREADAQRNQPAVRADQRTTRRAG
jgi:hypothetical protein